MVLPALVDTFCHSSFGFMAKSVHSGRKNLILLTPKWVWKSGILYKFNNYSISLFLSRKSHYGGKASGRAKPSLLPTPPAIPSTNSRTPWPVTPRVTRPVKTSGPHPPRVNPTRPFLPPVPCPQGPSHRHRTSSVPCLSQGPIPRIIININNLR